MYRYVSKNPPKSSAGDVRRHTHQIKFSRIIVFGLASFLVAAIWTYGGLAKTTASSYFSGTSGLSTSGDKQGKNQPSGQFTESPQFTQGFETDAVWGDPATDPTRVPSGTHGIASKSGAFHAEAVEGNFTRWGGYNSVFPAQGYTTSVAIYLNVSGGFANDTRFDFTSAVNQPDGNHRRDFAFNAGYYSDATAPGSGPRFVVSASNGTGRANAFPKNPGRDPFVMSASGWYTFKHTFYNNGTGVLAVALSILDSAGSTLHTWTLSDPSDVIGSTVGGNRYGWFPSDEFSFLAIDDSARSNILQDAPVKVKPGNLNGWTAQVVGPTAAGSFAVPPAGQPLGKGSYHSTIGADGDDFTRTHNGNYSGVRLDQISALSYSTYVAAHLDSQAHYLSLRIDYDGDSNYDDTIYFEPGYQTATYFPSNPQPALALNTWQTWNARTGGWWSANGIAGANPGVGVKSLAQYLAVKPNARIMNEVNGGVRVIAGGGNPSWNNFDGSFDNLTIGVSGNNTTFDFDPALTTVVDDDGMGTAADCNAPDVSSTTLADAYSVADPGDTITVCPGTYTLTATLGINKANITILGSGAVKPVIQATSAIGNAFLITGSGVTLQNLEIKKTDLANQDLIAVQANNFTAQNNLIYGPDPGTTWDVAGFVSRGFVLSAQTGTVLQNNVIHHLRQPAYMSGGFGVPSGTISGNQVSGTKGWVVEGGAYTFTGNTFGEPQNQSCDIALLSQPTLNPANYQPLSSLSLSNDDAFICAQYPAGENGRAIAYVDDNASPNGNGSDNANYQSINTAIAGTLTGGTVQVAAGGYNEDVTVGKTVILSGSGSGSTIISGPIGGPTSTVQIAANNVEVRGFTITRAGNDVADWNDPNLNVIGVGIQGGITNANVHDNRITGNRNGIDINNSSGHTFHNNLITDNRTGGIFRNQTDNLNFYENEVTNNWTVGFLFLDGSPGTNSPVQSALNCSFTNNNFSGNWYGQIVDRQTGGALPAPGADLKNFSGNWFGTNTPVVTANNSTEPGYAAQIPVEFGGAAVPPGGQPDIAGPASANFDYSPFLNSGSDTNATFGFQGSFSSLNVTAASPQAATGNPSNIQEGINLLTVGGSLNVAGGTYAGNVDVNKAMNLKGNFTVTGSLTTSAAGSALSPGNSPGIINSGDLALGSGSTVNIELNGPAVGTQYDQLNVSGTVNISANAFLNVSTGFTPGSGSTFIIINNDGADPVVGTFKDMPEGTVFYVGPNAFRISYVGGSGNDVVLTAVSLCNAVSIPNNLTSLTGTTVNVPVNVDNTTGNDLLSTDFTVTYNPAVISTPVVSLGSVTTGSVLTVNSATPGTLTVSIFSGTPFTGAGTLANISFNVVGNPSASSPVSFTAFKFNEGTACISTSNGQVTVNAGTITGTITYGNAIGAPAVRDIQNVTLNAVGSVNVSASTNAGGIYTLSGMGSGPYDVTPSRTGADGALSGLDSALIAQYVVGSTSLNPTQQTVADVSGTGGITSFDAALIARYVVSLPGTGNAGNWIFSPVNRHYNNVNTNLAGQDYVALLMGDVSGNWTGGTPLPGGRPLDTREAKPIGISAGQVTVSPNSEVTVPVVIGKVTGRGIVAYQFEMAYDPAVLTPSTTPTTAGGTLSENMLVTVNSDTPGLLKVVVFGALPLNGEGALINLHFTAIGAIGTSSSLTWQNFMLNEGDSPTDTVDGRVTVTQAAANELSISGNLLTAQGQGVPNTRVTLTGINGGSRSVISNGFGYYEFGDVEPGQTYTISVESRRYTFTSVMVSATDNLTNINLIAQP